MEAPNDQEGPQSSGTPTNYENKHVHEVYDAIASHFSSTRYKPWPRVKSFLENLPAYALLADVGCGNGKNMFCASLGSNKVFGIGCDRSENLLRIAVEGSHRAHYEEDQKRKREKIEEEEKRKLRRIQKRRMKRMSTEEGEEELPGLASATMTECSSSKVAVVVGGTEASSPPTTAGTTTTTTTTTTLDTPKGGSRRQEGVVSDGMRTSFRANCFDAAISIAVIHHFSTPERRAESIRELLRIVRPGGKVLIYVWAKEQVKDRGEGTDVLIKWEVHNKFDAEEKRYERYYHLFVQGELEDLCRSVGCVDQLSGEASSGKNCDDNSANVSAMAKIVESYFDKENWCIVLEKLCR